MHFVCKGLGLGLVLLLLPQRPAEKAQDETREEEPHGNSGEEHYYTNDIVMI